MKLYATTTSERASKGQGGGKLKILIQCGSKERGNILELDITSTGDGKDKRANTITALTGEICFLRSLRSWIGKAEDEYLKGEQQKGDKCYECGKIKHLSPFETGYGETRMVCDDCYPEGKQQKGEVRCKHGVILKYDDCLNCDKGDE